MNQNNLGLGLIYLALGTSGLWIGVGYPLGSISRMGPGFLPTVISLLLLIFAAVSLFRAASHGRPKFASVQQIAKAGAPVLIVVVTVLTFAMVVRVVGLFPAALLLIFMAATASPEFKLRPVPLAGAFIVAGGFSYLFVYLLGLPLPYVNMSW